MHEATGTFEIGNPNLGKEKAATVEAGLKKATGPLRFDASAYYTRFDGFIYQVQLTGAISAVTTFDECPPGGSPHPDDETFKQAVFTAARRDLLRRRALGAATTWRAIWSGVWGVDGAVRLRARQVRRRRERAAHPAAPARRRHLLPRRRTGSRASACCTPSTRTSFGLNESGRPELYAGQRRAELHVPASTRPTARHRWCDHRPARREPRRRRRARPRPRSSEARTCCCPAPACGSSAR